MPLPSTLTAPHVSAAYPPPEPEPEPVAAAVPSVRSTPPLPHAPSLSVRLALSLSLSAAVPSVRSLLESCFRLFAALACRSRSSNRFCGVGLKS